MLQGIRIPREEMPITRKDVLKLATKLSCDSEIDAVTIYEFLMVCGRAMGRNPTELNWIAAHKIIFLAGKRDAYYLKAYIPNDHRQDQDGDKAEFWETQILTRQDELN